MFECYLRVYPEDDNYYGPRDNWELIGFKVEHLPSRGDMIIIEGFIYEVVNVWWEPRDHLTLVPYIHVKKLGPDEE